MIEVRNLSFSYGDKVVLEGFSLKIPRDGVTAVQGPSGLGKTTLLRLLAGLERPAGGEILGVVPEECAFLFQENRLLPWRTAAQQLTDVMPRPDRELARALLSLVELEGEEDRWPRELSGGMCRRLALGRCLALGSPLLLLDEPFAGVDPDRAERILTRLKNRGQAVIMVCHEERLAAMADRVVDLAGCLPQSPSP